MTPSDTRNDGATKTTSLRIYVACLAAYNNGRLHGKWIAADQSFDALVSEVRAMLATSPEPEAEEWAIHDYEGFGLLRLSENERLSRVSAIAAGIAQHGPAFSAWLSHEPARDPSDQHSFVQAYKGEWKSMEAYLASTVAHDVRTASPLASVAEMSSGGEQLANDTGAELYTVPSGHGTVYVFGPSA